MENKRERNVARKSDQTNVARKSDQTNVLLALRQTNALSGTPKLFNNMAMFMGQLFDQVSVAAESVHPDLEADPKIATHKMWKWPKNNINRRKFFSWQVDRLSKKKKANLVIGHGDTLHQDILCLHTCVHKAQELNPEDHRKNLSVPFHRDIFTKGSFKVLVCNSNMMKDDVTKRFNITTPVYTIYPGMSDNLKERIEPAEVAKIRAATNGGDDTKIVLGVITSGNLNNRGAFNLLKAIGMLSPEERRKISLLVVGKESKPQKLYDLAKEAGFEGQVNWMKPIPNVTNVIDACDLIVHAAKMEAFGMSVLESMNLGKPILATRTIGCTELFGEKQKDLIIEKPEPAMIAEKLKHLIANPQLLKELGEENAKNSEGYTWEGYNKKFKEVLDKHF